MSMNKEEWKETKRELRRLENGVYVPERITEERKSKKLLSDDKKELVDLTVKSVGVISIFIPLLLLYLRYNQEIAARKNAELAELFSSISTDLENLISLDAGTTGFQLASDNLLFRYGAKLALFKNDSFTHSYASIKTVCLTYKAVKEIAAYADSVMQGYDQVYNYYRRTAFPENDFYEITFRDPKDQKLRQIAATKESCEKLAATLSKNARRLKTISDVSDGTGITKADSFLQRISTYTDSLSSKTYDIRDIKDEMRELANYLISGDLHYFEEHVNYEADELKPIDIVKQSFGFYINSLGEIENLLVEKRKKFESTVLKEIR